MYQQSEQDIFVNTAGGRHLQSCIDIQAHFERVNGILEQLEPYTRKLEKAVSADDQRDITEYVEKEYKQLRMLFKDLESDIKGLESAAQTEDEFESPKDREVILSNVKSYYKTLQTKLEAAQKVYSEFKTASKKKLTRQIRNLDVNNQFTDEQIEVMTEQNPDAVNELVQEKLFGKANLKLQYEAQDILEKCEGIKRLQKSIRELLDMLKDVSQIVMLQGEQINTIADHVTAAKDYMIKGNENLVLAKKHHSDARCVS